MITGGEADYHLDLVGIFSRLWPTSHSVCTGPKLPHYQPDYGSSLQLFEKSPLHFIRPQI